MTACDTVCSRRSGALFCMLFLFEFMRCCSFLSRRVCVFLHENERKVFHNFNSFFHSF